MHCSTHVVWHKKLQKCAKLNAFATKYTIIVYMETQPICVSVIEDAYILCNGCWGMGVNEYSIAEWLEWKQFNSVAQSVCV